MRITLIVGGVLTLSVAGAWAQPTINPELSGSTESKNPQSFQADLTPDNFGKLHALIRPHEGEWRHLQVRWLTDVVAVRKKAAAEDKPIVICYTGGAGYNEPLGVC